VLPGDLLRRLGIRPHDAVRFRLADGTSVSRPVGRAFVRLRDRAEYTRVVLGEPGDSALLSVLTLEELGLWIDPLKRESHQIQQML
jgi:predicted aspartyl protease